MHFQRNILNLTKHYTCPRFQSSQCSITSRSFKTSLIFWSGQRDRKSICNVERIWTETKACENKALLSVWTSGGPQTHTHTLSPQTHASSYFCLQRSPGVLSPVQIHYTKCPTHSSARRETLIYGLNSENHFPMFKTHGFVTGGLYSPPEAVWGTFYYGCACFIWLLLDC